MLSTLLSTASLLLRSPSSLSLTGPLRYYSRVDKNAGLIFKTSTSAAATDPSIVHRREEKRLRKIERVLRRVDRPNERVRVPVKELEEDPRLTDPALRVQRTKPSVQLSTEEEEQRIAIKKEWNIFANQRYLREMKALDRVLQCQRRALEQLKRCNESLYMSAISFDESLLPFKSRGPVRTPPIHDHIQDGEITDVTKKHEVQYEDIEAHWKRLSTKKRTRKKKGDSGQDDD